MDKPRTIEDILAKVSEYLKEEKNLALIKDAYVVACEKHKDQMRKSGDPYVQHPIEVAYLLAELHTGPATIAAGLLHDVLEDTDMTKEEMAARFGNDVAEIVDGVTKISKLKYMTKERALAHDHQKILLAMAKDIRVVLVKLVDRLHNMRTLSAHNDIEKQKRIAKETLDLYAPLAHRLGMYRFKAELEDISLKYLNEAEYKRISEAVMHKKSEREKDIDEMISQIEEILKDHNVTGYEIKGRIKNIYSIYKKIMQKGRSIEDIYDLLALRIVVDSVEDCYRILGLVHGKWTPIPMRFKDYIAVPKPNLYQSLHTTIVGINGRIFEIQIRTYEMDQVAEYGVAAHWAYKEENKGYSPEKEHLEITNKLKWLKDLSTYVEMSDVNDDPLESIIEDIFSANVYIFTPKGKVIDLPNGSTPIDFAYRIHTEIGNKTTGAIVNGRIVPLSYQLKTGDVVEIKTNKNSPGPSTEWLKIVKTSHARHKIKAYINKMQRDLIIERGRTEFERYAKTEGYNPNDLNDKTVQKHFTKNNVKTVEEFYYEVGTGTISPHGAVNRILGLNELKMDEEFVLQQYKEEDKTESIAKASNAYGIIVEGLDKAQLRLANCCQPIMGDEIVGYVSKGTGIVVHRANCPNVTRSDKKRFINIHWDAEFTGRIFQTTLRVDAMDKKGLLPEMINLLNSTRVTITSVSSAQVKLGECVTKFRLNVANLEDLNHAIVSLSKISEIYDIVRVIN